MYTLAYVTYQDIRSIQAFQKQIVIAIKAPEETKLEIPIPKEVSFITFSSLSLLREEKLLNFCLFWFLFVLVLQQWLATDFQFLCHV